MLEYSRHLDPAKGLDYNLALRPLTGLTELAIGSGGWDNVDLRLLLILTRLRVLDLCHSCLTGDVVGVLTNLGKLRLVHCGVASLASVTQVFKPSALCQGLAASGRPHAVNSFQSMLCLTTRNGVVTAGAPGQYKSAVLVQY